MGSAVLGQCLSTADAAAAYACGTAYPQAGIGPSGEPVSVQCVAAAGDVLSLEVITGAGPVVAVSTPFAAIACDENEWLAYHPWSLTVADSLLLSGAVIGVWLLAAGYRAMRSTVEQS